MELPKYTTQIGMPNGSYRIFIEDYVISYIKQIGRETAGKKKKIALFGMEKRDENMNYFFVYGAACLTWGYGRDDYFSEQEMQEAENRKKNYFDDYPLIGWCCIENELQDGLYILQNKHGIYIEGFHIFYERNESMLAFLIHRHVEKKEEQTVKEEPILKAEEREVKEREVKEREAKVYRQLAKATPAKNPPWAGLKTAALSAFLVISAMAILVINGSIKISDFKNTIGKAILAVNEKKIPDRELVMDDNLMKEIQKENEPAEEIVEVEENVDVEESVDVEENTEEEENVQTDENIAADELKEMEEAMGQSIETKTIEHIIKRGETLISISKQYYGDDSKVSLICEMNHIQDADSIQIGQKIILP